MPYAQVHYYMQAGKRKVSAGADVNAKGANEGFTPLHLAATVNASATAEVLLKAGADANAKINDGLTPLHVAAYQNASATAEVLPEAGVDVNAKGYLGVTPLHVAAVANASATAEVLGRYGGRR